MSAAPLTTENNMTSTPRAGAANVIVLRPISLRRLVDLLLDDEDEDQASITRHAFKTAYRLIEDAESVAGRTLISSPVVDSEGGVRITWRHGNRQVKLVCPGTD